MAPSEHRGSSDIQSDLNTLHHQADLAGESLVNGMESSRPSGVSCVDATDWLLRVALPQLLTQTGRVRAASALSSLPSITAKQLSDRYGLVHVTSTVRAIRSDLNSAVRREWSLAETNGVALTINAHGGPVAVRAEFFPCLDQIAGYVTRSLEFSGAGRLLQLSVELAINLVLISHDNNGLNTHEALIDMSSGYEASLRILTRTSRVGRYTQPQVPDHPNNGASAERLTELNPQSIHPSKVRIEAVSYPTSGRVGYRAVTVAVDGTLTPCGHRHLELVTARRCGKRLANQSDSSDSR